jgi:hypothetical protein
LVIHNRNHGAAAPAFLYEPHQTGTFERSKAAKHLAGR